MEKKEVSDGADRAGGTPTPGIGRSAPAAEPKRGRVVALPEVHALYAERIATALADLSQVEDIVEDLTD